MSKGIELYRSRVSHLVIQHGSVTIHFPHAYIYKAKGLPGRDPGSGWSQEVELILDEATIGPSNHLLPNMINDGYFEVDDERYEVVPVPLGEHERGHLHLEFDDGGILDVTGSNPVIKLIGKAIPLEDFS
jgi:hypothetical protein